MITQRYISHN